MVKDIEGNRIEIQEGENFHEKAIGKSGSGKTYWACNRVEEYARIMPVVILDFSYTYTEDQTEKNGVWRASSITRFNLKNKNFKFIIDDADACEMVTDLILPSNLRCAFTLTHLSFGSLILFLSKDISIVGLVELYPHSVV